MTADTCVPVIIGSTRRGRVTPRVATFVTSRLSAAGLAFEVIDLADAGLPFLEERLMYLEDPPPSVVRWGKAIERCRVFVVVSPEYNGGCPGVLKNAIDFLKNEYREKHVGIVAVSGGPHGGSGCLEFLTRTFARLKAVPMTSSFKVNNAADTFDLSGTTLVEDYRNRTDALAAELAAVARQP